MSIWQLLKTSLKSLASNKVRTFLTSLGIIIGIFSVIVLMSIGEGAKQSIQSSFNQLGANTLSINNGNQNQTQNFQRGGNLVNGGFQGATQVLTQEDLNSINSLKSTDSQIVDVMPELSRNSQVVYKSNNTNTSITGSNTDYLAIRNYTISTGVFLSDSDLSSNNKVAVLGATTKTTLFGDEDAIGANIKIGQNIFKVIGVLGTKGQSGFTNQDDLIIIPYTSYQKYIDKTSKFRTITVRVKDADKMSAVQDELTNVLLNNHKISDSSSADFNIRNSQDIINSASSVTQTFTLLLTAIASISLVVGGIGIMNTMIITVKDRTREIGLKKAIGAHESSILAQFLIESILITFIGGLIAVSFGYIVAYWLTYSNIIQTNVTLYSLTLSLGVSVLIGIVFGMYPAISASKLSPIQALRYE